MIFKPNLAILPPPQLQLWPELDGIPEYFALYGGTALALRFGHRASADFDFFSNRSFDPDELTAALTYLQGAERVRVAPNTLKCRVERGGPVLVSFFGGLGLGQVAQSDRAEGRTLRIASLLDWPAPRLPWYKNAPRRRTTWIWMLCFGTASTCRPRLRPAGSFTAEASIP